MTASLDTFIHRYQPANSDTNTTLLLLHGTGGDETSLLPLGRQFAPGAALLSPRGKVLEGGQIPRFFRRHSEGVLDFDDLRVRTHELADWIEAAVKTYDINPDSLVAIGYSNGANIAASLLLLRPGLLRRAVLLRAMHLPAPEPAPDLTGASVLISAGIADHLLPLTDAEHLAEDLQRFGAQVTLERQPADHRLVNSDLSVVQNWLASSQAAAHAFSPRHE